MRVLPFENSGNLKHYVAGGIYKNTDIQASNLSNKPDLISFMAIPLEAIKSKYFIPVWPEGLKVNPEPRITLNNSNNSNKVSVPLAFNKKNDTDYDIKYSVCPQDFWVTPRTEIHSLKGNIKPGPENDRIKVIDKRSRVASPDSSLKMVYDKDSPQFDRVNTFYFVNKTLDMYEKALGRKLSWSFDDKQLKIYSRAKRKRNAKYNRLDGSIQFCYFKKLFSMKEPVYTSRIADIVTHEAAHAILDGLKPYYHNWGSHSSIIHEGFSDCSSMLVALWNDNLVDEVIKETGGDLRKDNLIASLAEQFGKATTGKPYLRNANNNYNMMDFRIGKQSSEHHSFASLFDGMFYDLVVGMAQQYSNSMPLREALFKTREDLTGLFARAMADYAPPGNVFFHDIAKAILAADEYDFNGKYNTLIKNVLINRGLLNNQQIYDWESEQYKTPSLTISKDNLLSKKAIENLINNNKQLLGLPENNTYELESAYSAKYNQLFLQLVAPKKLLVMVPGNMGHTYQQVKVYDGVTLGFDSNKNLFYKAVNNTDEKEVEDAIKNVEMALSQQEMLFANNKHAEPLVYKESANSNVLVKSPIINL
ncbi:MAG: hypothetical protein AB1782_20445 [Cyanobacteriota bacterium]